MIDLILSSIYFILPAYFANMCPVILRPLPLGNPISEKLFGSHKTWRGFYTGYFGALLMLLLQFYIQSKGLTVPAGSYFSAGSWFPPTLLNYESFNLLFYAFLFGIGAITGDLIKSFFKRRLAIKPGGPFFPFDQLDFVIGAIIFVAPFYTLPWRNLLVILIITPLLHFLTNVLGYLLKLKKVWW